MNHYTFFKKKWLCNWHYSKTIKFFIDADAKFEPIAIEDVLGRKQKVHNTPLLSNIKIRLLITGAGGSIGGELVRQVCLSSKTIILLESNEYALYKISSEIMGLICKLADVRDLLSRGNYKRI